MDLSIAALLTQDGITNGAIYALLALALVLVFAVTRVIWVPSGEFVAFGTLTLAGLQLGKTPGTVGLLAGMAVDRGPDGSRRLHQTRRGRTAFPDSWRCGPRFRSPSPVSSGPWHRCRCSLPLQILATLAAVTALGPLLYRIAYQPVAEASVLVLLIVSVAVHFTLVGLGLWFFGAEGSRTPPFSSASITVGAVTISVQSLLVVVTSVL